MNIYTKWVELNNEIDKQLLDRKSTKKTYNSDTDTTNYNFNDNSSHETIMEYWRISKELSIFINNNFPDMAKEHLQPIYDRISSSINSTNQ